MADCFWTDLVGVTQTCGSTPVPSGYVIHQVTRGSGPVTYSQGLGRMLYASTIYGAVINSGELGSEWDDEIASFVGSTAAVAVSDTAAVALGSMNDLSTGPFTIDAVLTMDGVSMTRYVDVIPLAAMGYVFGAAYHPERGKYYALIESGNTIQVYEMGATPAEWASVLSVPASMPASSRPTITYLHGTHEMVVLLEDSNGTVHAYSLGETGGFVDHMPSGFTLNTQANPECVVSIAYCSGAAKYVVFANFEGAEDRRRILLASASLGGAFVSTGLFGGITYVGGYIVSPPGENFVVWGDWRLCDSGEGGSTHYQRILMSSDLVTATVLVDSITQDELENMDPDTIPTQILTNGTGADVYGFVPGLTPGTGTVFVDNQNYCV